MKKVLSLVLAFAMILGSFGFVFASQYSDVSDKEYYSEPVNVLSGLGVVNGVGNGKFDPEGDVTRAQMAVMLINCLGIPVGGKTDTGFTDCTASHWASPWVKYAANLGIIAGYGNGKFGPDDPVTYDQALTMIVASLGYTSEGLGGTWPGNFINQARALGILDTCKTTGSSQASRADICCFLYDALETPMGKTNKDGEFVATEPKPGEYDTILKRLGAHVLMDGDDPAELIWGADGNPTSVADLSQYFGQRITVMVNKAGEIVSVKEVITTDVLNTTYAKLAKAYKNVGTVAIDEMDAEGFVNGENVTSYAELDDWSGYNEDEPITVALTVSGKNIKTVDSIQIWNVDADDFAPDNVQDLIADKHTLLNKDLPEDEDGEIDTSAFVILGRDSLEDIAEDDVVFVYVGGISGTITKIEVGTETVEGKISKIDNTNKTATIGGKAYSVSAYGSLSFSDLKALMNGKAEGTFYLDYNGDLYAFDEKTAPTTEAYGIELRAWGAQNEDEYTFYIEIFTADGKAEKFEAGMCDAGTPDDDTDDYLVLDDFNLGDLALYTLDEDDVVITLDNSSTYAHDITISKNGLFDGNKITSSTVAFKYSGADFSDANMKAAKNWSVEDASELFGETVEDMIYIVDSNKTVKALCYTEVSEEAGSELAFFVDTTGVEDATTEEWIVLNNGKVETLSVKKTLSISPMDPYFLTVTDDVVTDVTDASGKIKDGMDVIISSTDTTSVSGNVFTSIDSTSYDLASDIIVYVCNADSEWRIGSTSNLKAKNGNLDHIEFYRLSGKDGVPGNPVGPWDIAFVWEN